MLGVVYELSDQDLCKLDRCERVPDAYKRECKPIIALESCGDDGCDINVWVYVAIPDPCGPFRPSPKYLQTIIDGAREHGLPEDYIEEIRTIAEAIDNK